MWRFLKYLRIILWGIETGYTVRSDSYRSRLTLIVTTPFYLLIWVSSLFQEVPLDNYKIMLWFLQISTPLLSKNSLYVWIICSLSTNLLTQDSSLILGLIALICKQWEKCRPKWLKNNSHKNPITLTQR